MQWAVGNVAFQLSVPVGIASVLQILQELVCHLCSEAESKGVELRLVMGM